MRPPCQDGVIISDGLLFWGPWMCGCQLSLYGHICLGAAGALPVAAATPEQQLQVATQSADVQAFPEDPLDWPAYQHDSWRSSFTRATAPDEVQLDWEHAISDHELPSAPIIAGDTIFVADRSGAVRALDADGTEKWTFLAGGPVYYPPTLENGRLFLGSADGHVYALEAATGRLLWRYRVAPQARWIPVYGRLISTWPVAGGVAVQDGIVYAAAGIAHYDGTHVVALDAANGRTVWQNDSSGALSEVVNCGISLQGELQVRGKELQFLGGGAYQMARYDRATGKCLNQARHQVTSQFATAFYPYFPEYGKYSSLNHTFPNGNTLQYFCRYDGVQSSPLKVLAPAAKPQASDQPVAKQPPRRGQPPQRPAVWQTAGPQFYTAFVVTPDTVIAGGPVNADNPTPQMSAISLKDGTVLWTIPLAANPVKAGIAMDSKGTIVVSLENGQLLCFAPKD